MYRTCYVFGHFIIVSLVRRVIHQKYRLDNADTTTFSVFWELFLFTRAGKNSYWATLLDVIFQYEARALGGLHIRGSNEFQNFKILNTSFLSILIGQMQFEEVNWSHRLLLLSFVRHEATKVVKIEHPFQSWVNLAIEIVQSRHHRLCARFPNDNATVAWVRACK